MKKLLLIMVILASMVLMTAYRIRIDMARTPESGAISHTHQYVDDTPSVGSGTWAGWFEQVTIEPNQVGITTIANTGVITIGR